MSQLSPAHVIRQILLTANLVKMPKAGEWPCYVGHLPDVSAAGAKAGTTAPAVPQNALCVYDTQGYPDGRLMGGEVIEHPGFQLRVRSRTYADAYTQARLIAKALSEVSHATFANTQEEGALDKWLVWNVSRDENLFHASNENGQNRYEMFTFNGRITFDYIPAP